MFLERWLLCWTHLWRKRGREIIFIFLPRWRSWPNVCVCELPKLLSISCYSIWMASACSMFGGFKSLDGKKLAVTQSSKMEWLWFLDSQSQEINIPVDRFGVLVGYFSWLVIPAGRAHGSPGWMSLCTNSFCVSVAPILDQEAFLMVFHALVMKI